MKIDAICVSVNYSDYLAWTLPLFKRIFDKVIIATSRSDKTTAELCQDYGIECIRTDDFYIGRKFSKSAGINLALQRTTAPWVCHVDADIVLPTDAKQILESLSLSPACIYGIDRVMCNSYKAWQSFLRRQFKLKGPIYPHPFTKLEVKDKASYSVYPFKLGWRFIPGAYVPIGYFQLWNAAYSGIRGYPNTKSAAFSDTLFPSLWRPQFRRLIPEIVAIHLDSQASKMGTNWNGRKAPRFVPQEVA